MIRTAIPKKPRLLILSFIASLVVIGSGSTLCLAQSKQLSLADILIALRSKKAVIEEKNKILADAVKARGITFALTPEIEKELSGTGAYPQLIDAIREKGPKPEAKVETPMVQIASSNPKPIPPPPDFAYYRTRASAAIAAGDQEGALIELGKAIELKPQDASSYAERGVIYLKQEKADLAVAEFSKAVERDPKDSASWFRRASIKEKLGDQNAALADYEKALEADSANEPAKSALTRIKDAQAKATADLAAATAAKAAQAKPVIPSLVSLGALNDYAIRLAPPTYSPIDRRMGIQGKVTVKISLDAEGKVDKCEAFDGPKTLRQSAEDAVKRSKFKPVTVNGVAVPATGFIIYNFVANP